MFHKLRMARTPCYGDCPVYEVEVSNTGQVKYTGQNFVAESGSHIWMLAPKRLRQLQDLIEWFDFTSFRYESMGSATDHPSCEIFVELLNGTAYEIHHYHGDMLEPDVQTRLTRLENRIESILGLRKYVRPPFYIYTVEYRGGMSILSRHYVVIARNVKEALKVVCDQALHQVNFVRSDWRVEKIGRATRDHYVPYVVYPEDARWR